MSHERNPSRRFFEEAEVKHESAGRPMGTHKLSYDALFGKPEKQLFSVGTGAKHRHPSLRRQNSIQIDPCSEKPYQNPAHSMPIGEISDPYE
ncbi:hypothetical protein [Pseudomonas gingeri]